jgi:signal transduction histidine kinase
MVLVGLAGLGFAASMVAWNRQDHAVRADIENYHLRSVSLASGVAADLADLRRSIRELELSAASPAGAVREASTALAAARLAIEEIQALEPAGGEPQAAIVRSVASRFDRLASLIEGEWLRAEKWDHAAVDAAIDSLSLAVDQLRRLHAIDAGEHVASMASSSERNRTAALIGLLFVAVMVAIGSRILVLLRGALTEEEALRASLERARTSQQRTIKMEALGRLSGGVAHDFNNLLTVILAHSELIEDSLEAESPLRVETEGIQLAIRQAADLTRRLLVFSRSDPNEPKRIDLNELTRQMEILLSRLLGGHCSLNTRLSSDVGAAFADPRAIERVLVNLVSNAADAMPDGGTVTIETANGRASPEDGDTTELDAKDDFVRLSVCDTGTGMDEETRSRVFDPFFTTKAEGEGTGLGLSTVHGVVTQAGGWVEIESELEIGTRVDVYLPRCEDENDDEAALAASPINAGSKTILVVEDEDEIRRSCVRILRDAGYHVLASPDGPAALELFAQHEGIDLILTDVVMPGMTGAELIGRAKHLRPKARVLFMSGYSGVELPPDGRLLRKPFRAAELLSEIRSSLAE